MIFEIAPRGLGPSVLTWPEDARGDTRVRDASSKARVSGGTVSFARCKARTVEGLAPLSRRHAGVAAVRGAVLHGLRLPYRGAGELAELGVLGPVELDLHDALQRRLRLRGRRLSLAPRHVPQRDVGRRRDALQDGDAVVADISIVLGRSRGLEVPGGVL